jgi:hypothetical protein
MDLFGEKNRNSNGVEPIDDEEIFAPESTEELEEMIAQMKRQGY